MSHSHHIRSRFIRGIALGLAVAAVAAPSAAASEPYSPLYTRTAPAPEPYSPLYTSTGPGTVVLPAIEVNADGFLTATAPPIRVVLPSVEVNADGFLTAEDPPISVVLPAVEVNADGFLTAQHKFEPNAPELTSTQVNGSQSEASAPAAAVSAPGFDYADAGVGAVIALGAALLAALCVLALRRSRRQATLA